MTQSFAFTHLGFSCEDVFCVDSDCEIERPKEKLHVPCLIYLILYHETIE